jgi:hypothetical protein
MGGQASSEDLFPLGYGERDRIKVRVRVKINLERLKEVVSTEMAFRRDCMTAQQRPNI